MKEIKSLGRLDKVLVDSAELIKGSSYIIVEIIEYIPNSVVSKTIIKKSTGNISLMSFDKGEGLTKKYLHLTHLPRSLKEERKS
jgi:hypothetical protein